MGAYMYMNLRNRDVRTDAPEKTKQSRARRGLLVVVACDCRGVERAHATGRAL